MCVALMLLLTIPFIFNSGDEGGGLNMESIVEPTIEPTVELITAQELLQYIRDNDVGVTEDDFNGIDVDEFIECWQITRYSYGNLRYRLDNYESSRESYMTGKLMVRELISVDSTQDEYDAFIETFFEKLNIAYETVGVDNNGLYYYNVYPNPDKRDAFNRYNLYIGKTMEFHQHDIRGTNLYLPGGSWGAYWEMNICYNRDNKFFLAVLGSDSEDISDGRNVFYEIHKLFTET